MFGQDDRDTVFAFDLRRQIAAVKNIMGVNHVWSPVFGAVFVESTITPPA